jgi:hypothetical protein
MPFSRGAPASMLKELPHEVSHISPSSVTSRLSPGLTGGFSKVALGHHVVSWASGLAGQESATVHPLGHVYSAFLCGGMGDGLIRAISSIFNAKSITQIRPSLFPGPSFPRSSWPASTSPADTATKLDIPPRGENSGPSPPVAHAYIPRTLRPCRFRPCVSSDSSHAVSPRNFRPAKRPAAKSLCPAGEAKGT